jgi:hypothetical protein
LDENINIKNIVHESSNINIAVANVGIVSNVDGKT